MLNLIDFHLKNGTKWYSSRLGQQVSHQHYLTNEHKKIIEIAVKECNSKIPVVAGTGSNSTEEAIELSRFAEKVWIRCNLLNSYTLL